MKHSLFQENREEEVAEEIQKPEEDSSQMALHLAKALVALLQSKVTTKIDMSEEEDC